MPGRRPKPTLLHKLQGTFHTGKHGRDRAHEPIAEGDLHAAPPGLTDSQRAVWHYAIKHAPKHLLKKIDRDTLLIWVEARDRWNTARLMQEKIDATNELKLLIRTPLGLVESPYNSILEKTARTMLRACQDLGFSPATRPRLQIAPAPASEGQDGADPWAMLRLIPGGKSDV